MLKIKSFLIYILILTFGLLLVVKSSEVSQEIVTAVNRCLFVIIPSLFSFMVFSDLVLRAECYKIISKPFAFISKYIFKMDSNLFFVFILGNICGYPIGFKLLNNLYSQGKISKFTAEQMSCYCYASGPSFVVGLVGVTMFSSATIGFVIFFANFLTNCVIAIVLNHAVEMPKIKDVSPIKAKVSIVDSVQSASKSMLMICSMILLFASIIGILKGLNIFKLIKFDILPLLEITNVVDICVSTDIIPIISAFISFGGVCILFQLKSLSMGVPLKYLILSRIPAVFLSAAFTRIITAIFNINYQANTVQTYISGKTIGFTDAKSCLPAILMVIMMLILIFTKEKNPLKK